MITQKRVSIKKTSVFVLFDISPSQATEKQCQPARNILGVYITAYYETKIFCVTE